MLIRPLFNYYLSKNPTMKHIIAFTAAALTVLAAHAERSAFNNNWQFALADTVSANTVWKAVTLPHDWSVAGRFDRNAPAGNDGAYLPTGTGWYQTTLSLPDGTQGKDYRLYFEGVYENSAVYVNGHHAGGHPYGYSSFFVDMTPYLHAGENIIIVKADNSHQKNCRWYSGSGIYRNVWLDVENPVRIADYGVAVTTPTLSSVQITVSAVNKSKHSTNVVISTSINDKHASKTIEIPAGGEASADFSFTVPEAKPWSPSSPVMYHADIELSENGTVLDADTIPFGFRTISYSANDGFRLNGEPMILNGACLHHDNGILGAAAYDRAEVRKARLMKDAGFNAVRTSHNPPSVAFLNACDTIGLLVIDEAFDGWRSEKNKYDYHLYFDKYACDDVARMVRRDRNHPSIFCWSIGNEIIERKSPQAVKDAAMLAGVCHSIDPTRPVTQALAAWDSDWEIYDPLAAEHDIVGYNYMIHKAKGDHARVPGRVMMQTESYPRDAWKNYRTTADHPYIIGDFVWTGLDYLGESGIGRWYYEGDVPGEHYHRPLYPWHAAYCGDVDLTGLRKPISHYRSMLWNADGEKLAIGVREPDGYKGKVQTTQWGTWPTFESWNWPGHEGKDITVEVYSRYPEVVLYLDGKLIDRKPCEAMMASFTLPYRSGTLRAAGIENDKVMESIELATAGTVADIRLTPEEKTISADHDITFIIIELVDAEGRVVSVADDQLAVLTEGPIELIALGNADIKDNDPYFNNSHKAWHGRAMAVIHSTGKPGKGIITVASPAVSKTIEIGVK